MTPVGSGIIRQAGGSTHLSLYALGWFVADMEGTPVVHHSGGAPGVTSNLILLPQKKIAVFASSNDYMSTAGAWTRHIADKLATALPFIEVCGLLAFVWEVVKIVHARVQARRKRRFLLSTSTESN